MKKKQNQSTNELTTREKGKKFLEELQKKGPLNDKLGESFVRFKIKN
jgi:predicted transcriptional regulator